MYYLVFFFFIVSFFGFLMEHYAACSSLCNYYQYHWAKYLGFYFAKVNTNRSNSDYLQFSRYCIINLPYPQLYQS